VPEKECRISCEVWRVKNGLEAMTHRVKYKARINNAESARRAELEQKPLPEIRPTTTIMVRFEGGKQPDMSRITYGLCVVEKSRSDHVGVQRNGASRAVGLEALAFALVGHPQERSMLKVERQVNGA
jgi:hypothetical protein